MAKSDRKKKGRVCVERLGEGGGPQQFNCRLRIWNGWFSPGRDARSFVLVMGASM